MTTLLLAWHSQPAPHGTNLYPDDLLDRSMVVELFRDAARFRAQLTAQGWRFLWAQYGLKNLLELSREAGGWDGESDKDAADALIARSLVAGYDPVSQTFRGYIERIEALLQVTN